MADRLGQVFGHITNTYGRGLLAGEVAIITGEPSSEVTCAYVPSAVWYSTGSIALQATKADSIVDKLNYSTGSGQVRRLATYELCYVNGPWWTLMEIRV